MVVRVDSGEKFYCGKNWAEQPACRTNMGAVKWSIVATPCARKFRLLISLSHCSTVKSEMSGLYW